MTPGPQVRYRLKDSTAAQIDTEMLRNVFKAQR